MLRRWTVRAAWCNVDAVRARHAGHVTARNLPRHSRDWVHSAVVVWDVLSCWPLTTDHARLDSLLPLGYCTDHLPAMMLTRTWPARPRPRTNITVYQPSTTCSAPRTRITSNSNHIRTCQARLTFPTNSTPVWYKNLHRSFFRFVSIHAFDM